MVIRIIPKKLQIFYLTYMMLLLSHEIKVNFKVNTIANR